MADTQTLPRQLQADAERAAQIARDAGLTNAPPAEAPVSEPTNSAASKEPQPTPAPAQDQQGDGNWEQKYKSLEGKYKAEVPRMARELAETRDLMRQLQDTVSALSQVPQQHNHQGYDPTDPNLAIDPTVREEYGPEFFELVAKVARQELAGPMNQITQAMEELRRGLVGTSTEVRKTAHQSFLEALDAAKNNWRVLNTDEGFKSWLEEADAFSGIARKHLLMDAYEAKDVQRTIAFFTGYETEHGISQPAARKPAAPRASETSLEALAAPGAGRPGQATTAQDDLANEIWTRAEIRAFYSDVRQGKFQGRDAERVAVERRITKAAAEGRVQGT